ncbi:ABC transporter permease [Brooklawnia cerclae]|uniref:ABC transport system permease protein n=1 Tax=Brooklawnia cerclae TaxID=349934 RepID=A0ABX0SE06_9ACTN|nr:ABC transporter permease [Brooklawnia cerclae]NIH56589.1 putative ABC transport system permease protein [Brooklawnia cerclae]
MKTTDLIASAISNTFRSRTRTILTVLSIFIGAFTLTITSGLGTGINAYIDDTVSGVGASNAMTVTKTSESTGDPLASSGEPTEYDPDAVSTGIPGTTVIALTPDDIQSIKNIDGILDVDPQRSITPDYIRFEDGTRYVASVGSLVAGQTTVLSSGVEPDDGSGDLQVALPQAYVEPLGLGDDADALGQTIAIAITDATNTQHIVEATVVGVTEEALASPTGSSVLLNQALTETLHDAQSTGLPATQADRYSSASVWFDPDATDAAIDELKDQLADAGYTGTTIADQLGMITTVIDGIVLVLNAFAVIALLAAAFGIVNTLYMSVQERTREIGLMKAMGMGSGRVFALFSIEATFIGFLGSAIGALVAIVVGSAFSQVLSETLLADLAGLELIAFAPSSIATIVILVMVIAFLAGTLPAARAARADPVDSLRYE